MANWNLALAFRVILMIVAIVLAIHCNPNQKLPYGLFAFVFSEIYLLQFGIRKYILKEPAYKNCGLEKLF